MIEIGLVLKTLEVAATVVKAAHTVYTWLKRKQQSGVDPNLLAVLGKLPPGRSEIAEPQCATRRTE
jgi:transposase